MKKEYENKPIYAPDVKPNSDYDLFHIPENESVYIIGGDYDHLGGTTEIDDPGVDYVPDNIGSLVLF